MLSKVFRIKKNLAWIIDRWARLDSEQYTLLRNQVLFGLLTAATQAESSLHAPVALGTGTFGLEGAGDVLVEQLTA
jgi:hypothetical protein